MSTSRVKAGAPRSVFFKPLTADVKGLFAALGKGIGHTAVGKWEELANDAIAAGSALGLTTDPGELAYLLISRAITRAMFELVGESASPYLVDVKRSAAELEAALSVAIEESAVQIDKTFFDRPADLPFLTAIQTLLRQWLALAGMTPHAVAAIVERLPAYFVFALNQEWRRNPKEYTPLLEAVQTPFAKAGERELAWHAYAALLDRQVQEGVFDEPFSLRQLYVPLRAYYTEDPPAKELMAAEEQRGKRVVVDLETELDGWLTNTGPADAIRVISGGPGSGKSSVARMYATRVAAAGKMKVLYIPLHLFDVGRDLADEVGRFVRDEGILVANPLDPESPEPKLFLIFDGLDEIAMQGKAAAEGARLFIDEIERTLTKRNTKSIAVRALISGRELVVQQNESSFRRPRQILNLLPYYLAEQDRKDFEDPSNLLGADDRQKWWVQYGRAVGRAYEGLPDALSRGDLEEVTAQPLLNYLVALSLTREKLDFSKGVNLNAVYADLLAAVYERAYERKRTFAPIRHMRFENFVKVLEEIGLAAWHGDGRTTTVSEIEQHCRISKIEPLLEVFKEGAQAGVTRLLAAFFFRQYGRRATGDPTFVFTHKSFGEYLAARRVVRAMDRIKRQRDAETESPGEGWSEKEALLHWAQICGPSPTTTYLMEFIRNEIALRSEEAVAPLQECFTRLFSYMLKRDFPIESLQLPTFQIAMAQSNNAGTTLLVALNACARRTQKVSMIEHPDRIAFGSWFQRVRGIYHEEKEPLLDSLSYLNLVETYLYAANLWGVDLSHSRLDGANLNAATFNHANVTGTKLRHAHCSEARFYWVTACEADFSETGLRRAHFFYADVTGAIFNDAEDTEDTIFEKTDTAQAIGLVSAPEAGSK